MAVASIFGSNNKLASSLVNARGSKGRFATALASATNVINPSANETGQAANQLDYNHSLGNVQSKLTSWFQAAGVDTTSNIQLVLQSDGTVTLANNPPDADKIQEVLDNHPEIAGMMQSLSKGYQKANPSTAPSSDSQQQFTLTLAAGQATGSME